MANTLRNVVKVCTAFVQWDTLISDQRNCTNLLSYIHYICQ